ncbi:phosphoribosylamine--glycine ligase [Hymenobacter busanensis]|uniref:Phosphoribosylamine--glycine ligase n=1 Tax=Hymenobacter busanensis TaxID=2607656 RepID=A0A7L5A1K4_9BACT|nr:phosphoribosylamine--glycine ligase [Hymenobacter busanensis]QHJ09689.1 phosphoribosylamine--glycine ligase [Hymenobacter busanensis]
MVLLGSGAREHALAWKLRQDGAQVRVLPGNAGIPGSVPAVSATDFPAIQQFCQEHDAKLIVVGPEAPLAAGVADYFEGSDIRVFGPRKAAAVLESSKVWSKDFMRRHGVATGRAWTFRSDQLDQARTAAAELQGHAVLKFDGLAAGKGVWVCASEAEFDAALTEMQALAPAGHDWYSFLVEEKLTGPEISIIGLTDGNVMRLFAPSQDHKQLLAGDQGPNTGGMGAYCPVPFADDNVLALIREAIIEPTLNGLRTEGLPFMGFLYFGIMLTPSGPKLLEYNVRLGDPEAQVLLASLGSSLVDLITAALDGRLAEVGVRQKPGAFVGVVLASGGYPAAEFPTGFVIEGIDTVSPGTLVFQGGTRPGPAGLLVTGGGRVLTVVASGPDLELAVERAYAEVKKITFQGAYYRTDIGQRPAPELIGQAY